MKLLIAALVLTLTTGFALKQSGILQSRCTKFASEAKISKFSPPADTQKKEAKSFALVELFTSEGCSSCPSADALLGKLAAEKKNHVYVLSYHVDYWNRLGWKDAFSKPEWTARQAAYVAQFRLFSAYTPQAVINGAQEFVGSSSLDLYTSVDKELHSARENNLEISVTEIAGKIKVTYLAASSDNATINLALVQTHAETDVKRGENGGKQLVHTNVVQSLATLQPKNGQGEFYFSLPGNYTKDAYKIIGFIQSKRNLEISAAAEAPIQ